MLTLLEITAILDSCLHCTGDSQHSLTLALEPLLHQCSEELDEWVGTEAASQLQSDMCNLIHAWLVKHGPIPPPLLGMESQA